MRPSQYVCDVGGRMIFLCVERADQRSQMEAVCLEKAWGEIECCEWASSEVACHGKVWGEVECCEWASSEAAFREKTWCEVECHGKVWGGVA